MNLLLQVSSKDFWDKQKQAYSFSNWIQTSSLMPKNLNRTESSVEVQFKLWEWAYAHIVGIWPTSFVNVVVSNNFIFFISVEMLRPAVLLQRNLWWVRVSSWWTALLWKPWAPEWAKSKEFSSRATKIDWLKKCKAKTGLEAQNHAGSFGELCIHGFLSLYDICQTERHSADSLEWLLKLLNCSMLDWLWDFKLEMIGMLT